LVALSKIVSLVEEGEAKTALGDIINFDRWVSCSALMLFVLGIGSEVKGFGMRVLIAIFDRSRMRFRFLCQAESENSLISRPA
jgi:hypothetical protein